MVSDVGTSEVSEKIFRSLILTVSYLSSPIIALTNCSFCVVRFSILINYKLTDCCTILSRGFLFYDSVFRIQ